MHACIYPRREPWEPRHKDFPYPRASSRLVPLAGGKKLRRGIFVIISIINLRSCGALSSDFPSLCLENGSVRPNGKFFFFLSSVDCCNREKRNVYMKREREEQKWNEPLFFFSFSFSFVNSEALPRVYIGMYGNKACAPVFSREARAYARCASSKRSRARAVRGWRRREGIFAWRLLEESLIRRSGHAWGLGFWRIYIFCVYTLLTLNECRKFS